jgi:deazaflavin-dependent oxidoreductase (nitroreductase family)
VGDRVRGTGGDRARIAIAVLTAQNVVAVEDSRVMRTTLVRYPKRSARALWAIAAPVHHRVIPYLLNRAPARTTPPATRPSPSTAGNTWRPRMSGYHETKFRFVTSFQRRLGNPVAVRMPHQTLLETTGRASGLPRRTPVGGRLVGRAFWLVSEYGEKSQYVRNIQAHPRVRVRIKGQWHAGTAHLLPEDDARARLRALPRGNSAVVRAVGTNLLTLRVDLD